MGFDDVFAVIAERTRRQILENLQDGDKAVGELVVELQVSQPTVSKHLKVLREAGLVTMRAQGQKRYYSLERAPLGRVGSWLSSLGASGASGASGAPGAPGAGDGTVGAGDGAALEQVVDTATRAAAAFAAGDERVPDSTSDHTGARDGGGGVVSAGRTELDRGAVLDGRTVRDGKAADRTLSGAVLAVSDERHVPDANRPQPGWTVGRAAVRAADLLAHLRRRRDPSA